MNAILEEVKLGTKEISFKRLVARMVAKSWFSILKYKLSLGAQDRLYILVNYIFKNSDLTERATEKDIVSFIEYSTDNDLIKLIKKFYKFVPYGYLHLFTMRRYNR